MKVIITVPKSDATRRGHLVDGPWTLCGRDPSDLDVVHSGDAPEIDCAVFVRKHDALPCGKCWEVLARRYAAMKRRRDAKACAHRHSE